MGGADVYCCLCGGPLSPPWWEVEGEDGPDTDTQAITTANDDNDEAKVIEKEQGAEDDQINEPDEGSEADENEADEDAESEENSADGSEDEVHESVADDGSAEPEDHEGDEEQLGYDPTIIRPDDEVMNWLRDVRLICENPNSHNPMKVYISGLAAHEDLNMFEVDAGDDVNFPTEDTETFYAYTWVHGNPMAMPFHWPCYKLLCKAVGVDDLDKESLYEALKGLAHASEYKQALQIGYGSMSKFQEQYFESARGYEYLVFSPLDVPQLAAYYKALPRTRTQSMEHRIVRTIDESDPFNRLPQQIYQLIIDVLDMADVLRLRTASSAIFGLELRNSFWRLRLKQDMPWLYDLPMPTSQKIIDSIDWARVYRDLHLAGVPSSTEGKILGLANRRRIWQTSFQHIIPPYLSKSKGKESDLDRPIVFQNASETTAPRLILPDPKHTKRIQQPLFQDYWQLDTICPKLVIGWSQLGELIGIQVGQWQLGIEAHKLDNVEFPQDDWLKAFIVTTREGEPKAEPEAEERRPTRRAVGLEIIYGHLASVKLGDENGDKRLIHVSPGEFAVGIRCDVGSAGHLSKVAILQQPYSKANQSPRIVDETSNTFNLDASKFLWRRELPPPPLTVSEYDAGYWAHDMQPDVSPMEALVFGTTEEELADITSLSADTQLGGFQITYGSRPTRTIGPRLQALKTLVIDGRNGERIVKIGQITQHVPEFIRFITNRNRQLIVGHQEGSEVEWPPSGVLAGFYGWWSERPKQSAVLSAVGCLYDTDSGTDPTELPNGQTDSQGFYWEPTTPAPTTRETGVVWGQRRGGEDDTVHEQSSVPDPNSVICFLDCSRRVSAIRSTVCHKTADAQLPLCRVTFRYSDNGEEVSAGPDTFPMPPNDAGGITNYPWCSCDLSYRDDGVNVDMKETSHFEHGEYHFSAMLLESLRIWLAPNGSLMALQFTGDCGETPVWTKETGELGRPSGEIRFSDGKGEEANGIKLFFNSTRRAVTREDSIIVAVQAMKRE